MNKQEWHGELPGDVYRLRPSTHLSTHDSTHPSPRTPHIRSTQSRAWGQGAIAQVAALCSSLPLLEADACVDEGRLHQVVGVRRERQHHHHSQDDGRHLHGQDVESQGQEEEASVWVPP